ncbi:unnamed protein product, partial [Ectocarpus sp. 4 AP-2014]
MIDRCYVTTLVPCCVVGLSPSPAATTNSTCTVHTLGGCRQGRILYKATNMKHVPTISTAGESRRRRAICCDVTYHHVVSACCAVHRRQSGIAQRSRAAMLMIPSSVVGAEPDWGRQEKALATFRILSHDNAESWKQSFCATSTRSGRSLDRLTRRRSVSCKPPQEQQEQERRKQILD